MHGSLSTGANALITCSLFIQRYCTDLIMQQDKAIGIRFSAQLSESILLVPFFPSYCRGSHSAVKFMLKYTSFSAPPYFLILGFSLSPLPPPLCLVAFLFSSLPSQIFTSSSYSMWIVSFANMIQLHYICIYHQRLPPV